MKRHVVLLAVLLVSCTEQAERTYTVDELIADEGLLSEIIATCRNNPGELGNTPNCQNAAAADFKARLKRM
ncbi:EexN family lipoprotein [Ensifer sesbaniae]|uniref:EexN family lipoprotein n=1 Tax=Ensifer sesbaniae TaxID=1214071 RepID=UPI0020017694|nr:EexN family lipoprotein [Ensifer sesbaniae]